MSWTYSGDPATSPLDEARFLIGDTDKNAPIMQDEEIKYLIKKYGKNQNMLMYQLFFRAATLFARDIKRSLGPQSEDPTSRLNFFKAQALEYEMLLKASGISLPKNAYPKIFYKGMQSNPPWPPPKGGKYIV